MLLGRIAARDNDTLADVSLNVPRIGRPSLSGRSQVPHHGPAGPIQVKEICPRGNNNIVIILFLIHDNIYIPC
jgi:hypothetical protein